MQDAKKLPQYSSTALGGVVQAVFNAGLDEPVDNWIKASTFRDELPQIRSTLGFLDLLTEPWKKRPDARLHPDIKKLRGDSSPAESLLRRFRESYVTAGCSRRVADLIGLPGWPRFAFEIVLGQDPAFCEIPTKTQRERAKSNPDTCRNAIRFAWFVHEWYLAELKRNDRSAAPTTGRKVGFGWQQPRATGIRDAPSFNDLGTIVNPKGHRICRTGGDSWVYGHVEFVSPQGATDPNWTDSLDIEEQAWLLDQLAARLLDDADSLRRGQTCGQEGVSRLHKNQPG